MIKMMMKAAVVSKAGGPEVLELKQIPKPQAKAGHVLINVKAFGINRSEMFTRQGHSPSVKFPRVLGIECVGVVEDPSDTHLKKGQTVAAVMGGMGREFDGGYAEYCCAPVACCYEIDSKLDWSVLGALPEMLLTSWGSLHSSLRIPEKPSSEKTALLIRGGTSSVGYASIVLARECGVETIIATTRSADRAQALKDAGAHHVVIDDGKLKDKVRQIVPQGVSHVLELIGTTTIPDSLQCCARRGIVCSTGILGNAWSFNEFSPMAVIPSTVCLTTFLSDNLEGTEPLSKLIKEVENGNLKVRVDKVFKLDEIVEAHRYMEGNKAVGKIVVLV